MSSYFGVPLLISPLTPHSLQTLSTLLIPRRCPASCESSVYSRKLEPGWASCPLTYLSSNHRIVK